MLSREHIEAVRMRFPQLNGRLFFDHAGASPTPSNVLEAAAEGMRIGASYSFRGEAREAYYAKLTETRELAARIVGAKPHNIAFTTSTSAGLSLVANAIPWQRGDNIVVSPIENPANVVPWLNLGELGVEVRFLPQREDDLVDVDSFEAIVDSRTRLVALSMVQYATGQRLDVARVAAFCRERGVLTVVDAVQAVGAIPVDVGELGIDLLACGGHKWILGPFGVGLLYVADAAQGGMRTPLLGEENVPDIRKLEEEEMDGPPVLRLYDGAAKFEAGLQGAAGIFGLCEALETIRKAGVADIAARLRIVTDRLIDGLLRIGGEVVSPRRDSQWSGIVSFSPAKTPARKIVERLSAQDVTVALRKGRVRISPHYYNTDREIDDLLEKIDAAAKM